MRNTHGAKVCGLELPLKMQSPRDGEQHVGADHQDEANDTEGGATEANKTNAGGDDGENKEGARGSPCKTRRTSARTCSGSSTRSPQSPQRVQETARREIQRQLPLTSKAQETVPPLAAPRNLELPTAGTTTALALHRLHHAELQRRARRHLVLSGHQHGRAGHRVRRHKRQPRGPEMELQPCEQNRRSYLAPPPQTEPPTSTSQGPSMR